MKFIPTHWSFESEKNGTVRVWQWLKWAHVYAGGFEQAGPYVTGLWRDALQHLPLRKPMKYALVLGMCAGDNIRLIQKRYKKAKIVAIEWDEKMIELALGLKHFKQSESVEIIYDDMRVALPTLVDSQFDIILSDAFYGDTPDVGADSPSVGEQLARVLAPDGVYILNASRTPEAVDYISRFLHLQKKWRFRDNTVAMFEK